MYSVEINKKEYNIRFDKKSKNKGKINDKNFALDLIEIGKNNYHVLYNNKSYNINASDINFETKELMITVNNIKHKIRVRTELDNLLKKLGLHDAENLKDKDLKAPMPGLIVEVLVNKGDKINKGENLIILEAMKMENNLKANDDVIIKKVVAKKGKAVEKNDVLIIFE